MATFPNIKHVERIMFNRTFMNEVVLFFTYDQIDLEIVKEDITTLLPSIECTFCPEKSSKDNIIYTDKDAIITFTPIGVLVSIPSKEYRDFSTTTSIWNHLEAVMKHIGVNPLTWTFTKGNRFVFNKPILKEQYNDVYKLILSNNLISNVNDKNMFVLESEDRTCVFTCRFGMENFQGKDSLGLKTMIVSQAYTIKGLANQVLKRNEDMFDCWYWCMSEKTLSIMNNKA